MFNQRNCNCGFDNGMQMNGTGCPEPIYAPKKVCVTTSNRYVEQPVICPIECRHIENVVYCPKYYPKYEQTVVVQDPYNNGTMNNQ